MVECNNSKNKIPISVALNCKNIKQNLNNNKLFSVLKKIKKKKCTKRRFPIGAFLVYSVLSFPWSESP